MKILVTGGMGMLGSSLIPHLQESGHDVLTTDLGGNAWLDVRIPADIKQWMGHRPDLVAHLAAETSLEICEADPDHAWLTNAIGTKNVALACRRSSTPMAYISSAGIFNGESDEPYTEFDTPDPINVYGASKYEGELIIQGLVPEHYIVRAGWMMSGGPHKDHKFVHHIVNQINESVTTIHAVADKFGSPTYAPDFAKCFERLIRTGDYGTYHMTSPGVCSRFDIAKAIVEILGRDDVTVKPASSAFFATTFPAPRPTSEAMRNYVLDLTGQNTMRPWREALEDYLKDWA